MIGCEGGVLLLTETARLWSFLQAVLGLLAFICVWSLGVGDGEFFVFLRDFRKSLRAGLWVPSSTFVVSWTCWSSQYTVGLRARQVVLRPILLLFQVLMQLFFAGLGLDLGLVVVVWVVVVLLGLVFRRGAVLSNFIHKEDLRHVVYDEDFGPLRNWLGFSSTEMYVHNEDGQCSRGCYHGHCSNVVFSCGQKPK